MAEAPLKVFMPLFKFQEDTWGCINKFGDVLKANKENKQLNSIYEEALHACKFYDFMDTLYHYNGVVVKHIFASTSNTGNAYNDGEEVKEEINEQVPSSTNIN